MSFREALQRYNVVNTEARRLRNILQSRYGWDERKQAEEMHRLLTKEPLLPPRPPLGHWGRPPRRGQLF
jgi:hypothetical protein